MMVVADNTVVMFYYRLSEVTDSGHKILEDNFDKDAVAYLHGKGGLIPGVEEAMDGKLAGDEFEITLEPGNAYGERVENARQRIPIKHLHQKKHLRAGMAVSVNTPEGARDVVIEKVGKFNVDVDTNHPLAGKILHFKLRIDNVRDATQEEIAHGHAHGPGGHHH